MFTNCISPPELDDKQLLAYLDNREADPATALHLKKCPYCREKAEALDRLQKRLTTKLYRFDCPSPLELGEYHLRMLPSPQMLVVAKHARECPHCAREIAELEEFLGDRASAEGDSLIGKAKVLIARLLGGNQESMAPGVSALRGETKGPLTFEADGMLITLDFQPAAEGRVTIIGQVAAEDQDQWTGAEVKIEQADGSKETARIDDLGAFHIEETFSGPIQITVTSPDGIEVQIPNIDINI